MIDEKTEQWFDEHPEWDADSDLIVWPPGPEAVLEEFPDADEHLVGLAGELVKPRINRGAVYMRCRRAGESDRMAAMLALQRGPVISTDDTFFQGQGMLADQFRSEAEMTGYLKMSAKQGFTPPAGAVYFPNLARSPGDPQAYVTRAMGKSYIKKLLEKRGWSSDGAIKTKGRQPEKDPREGGVPLAKDLVNEYAEKAVNRDPSMKLLSRAELREAVIAKHGSKRG